MVEVLRGRLRKWFSCRCGRQPFPFRRRRGSAHDVGLDHKVVSTANHHKVFDIVAADEDDASFAVDREGFDYCYPRWCVAAPTTLVALPLASTVGTGMSPWWPAICRWVVRDT
jgi:hypothetical protein